MKTFGTRFLMRWVAAGLSLATTTGGRSEAGRPSPADYLLHPGLSYAEGNLTLTLDLFLPREAPGPMPCVVVIQGGGFRAQDGQGFRSWAEHLARNGFAAALIAYRGRPDHTYQDTVADVRAAVRFLRRVSRDYDLDAERIGAMGRSAGATLAVLLAVGDGVEGFENEAGNSVFPSRIQAAVGIAGVYDFVARFTDEQQTALQPNLDVKLETNAEWVGSTFAATDEHWHRVSAINHVDALDPPVLLLHSRNDPTVPWLQSKNMHERLTQAGTAAEIEITDEGGHGGPATAQQSMITFFRKVLKDPVAASVADSPRR